MDFREDLIELINKGIAIQYPEIDFSNALIEKGLEKSKEKKLGDFALGCFLFSKQLRKSPAEIAKSIEKGLVPLISDVPSVESIKAVGPFLNFKIDTSYLASQLIPKIQDDGFLEPLPSKNQKVMIEYSQPNSHKAFHVGHIRNAALGNSLVNLFQWNGYEVVAANYIGDVGTHIAKCLWYFKTHFKGEIPKKNRGEFLGSLYENATLLLDFNQLTSTPFPGIITAQVSEIRPHPENPNLHVVCISTGTDSYTVVCGGKAYSTGDIVAYAAVGSKVGGRLVQVIDKLGVESRGMICSEKELRLSKNNDKVFVFEPGTPLGIEIAEVNRKPSALDPEISVIEIMEQRTREVAEILRGLENKEPEIQALWKKTRQWSLDEFEEIYNWLDCRFDHYFYESDVGNRGKELVQTYYKKGIFIDSEGAIGADLASFNLPFFLLLKSDGTGLYSTKDLALAEEKFKKFLIDRSVYVVDATQSLHFQQVFKSLELMGFKQAANCYHLPYGLVVLPEGKMSSRAGNVILFSQLKDRLIDKVTSEFLEKYRMEWGNEEIDRAAQIISTATIKYGMLNQDNKKNIVFNLDEWTARTGNTGPYLLYAYARTRSILRELGDPGDPIIDYSKLSDPTEQTLLSAMAEFKDVSEKACLEYKPQLLCIYLYHLAKEFSRMYDSCPVLKAPDKATKSTRAALVDTFGKLLKKGLSLLGIQTLDRM